MKCQNLLTMVSHIIGVSPKNRLVYAFIPWSLFLSQNGISNLDPSIVGQKLKQKANVEIQQSEAERVRFSIQKNCRLTAQPDEIVELEIAATDSERQKGLSERKNALKKGTGMVFLFSGKQTVSFWMKRTFIPLQIIFFDQKGRAIQSYEMPVEQNPDMPVHYYQTFTPTAIAVELPPRSFPNPVGRQLCVYQNNK